MSCPPDPALHAYRKDLADVALAGRVIASHYAEPLLRHLTAATVLRAEPGESGEALATLDSGEPFQLLDSTRGWAWGYSADGRVGYVAAGAVGI